MDNNTYTSCRVSFSKSSVSRKNDLSKVIDNSFFIFKESDSLYVYGESLTEWLSIGGLIQGSIKMKSEKGVHYYKARISPSIFIKVILEKGEIFDVLHFNFGYKIKVKHKKL